MNISAGKKSVQQKVTFENMDKSTLADVAQ